MLRTAGSVLIAAASAFLTFGVVSAATDSEALSSAATAHHTAARIGIAAGQTPVAPPPSSDVGEGAEVVSLLNAERAARGLPPVAIHSQVVAAAAAHSADQATTGQMSHTGSDGSNTGDRLDRAGFDWHTWAENVGAGYLTPAHMFDGWMNSDGHRVNMLGNYAQIGVAVVDSADGTRYWTMVLAN